MGVLKRKVSSKAKGFTPYAGEEPPRGVYRARVVKGAIRSSKEKGTLSYNILFEFEATKAEHKKFDGFTGFAEIWLGEHEALQAREASFIKAVTGKDDFQNVNVAFTGKEADFKEPSGAPITAIDGKKIEGKVVNVEWRWEAGNGEYEGRMRANSLFPWVATEASDEEAEEIEDDDYAEESEEDDDYEGEEEGDEEDEDGEEGEEDEDLEAEIEERRKELRSRKYSLEDLKKAAKAAGADIKGMKKTDLVEAILDYEFSDEGDEDEESDVDEEENGVTEADLESDEDEEEDDEDEDDEEDEDEEEDDDNLEEVLRGNAADLDRNALKKAIKEKDAEAGFKKSETDDDLRERLVQIWLTNPPF